ncbi:MAG: hypothetical protein P1U87_12280 [Verrucomicrobiales bacterium]|nr:hypothetical protein [Verrucomicrobiales bacterium]
MNRVLLEKEWRQNGGWFVLLIGFSWALFFLIVRANSADGTGAGIFSGLGTALWVLLPFSLFIVGHLLVANEFRKKTQLFLEGLPLPKWRMILIKAFLTVVLASLIAGGGVLMGWWWAKGAEAMTVTFLNILLATAVVWSCFVASFSFLLAFLGRYRIPVILLILFGLMWMFNNSSIPVVEFPPFDLVRRFGFEREEWPAGQLSWTGAFTILFFVSSFLIGLIKEGSVAAMLGEKMSYREKLVIGTASAIGIFALLLWEPAEPEPFSLPGAVSENWNGSRVYLSPLDRKRAVDEDVQLASYLARNLSENWKWLGIPADQIPAVYIVEREAMEDERIDWEDIDGERVVFAYAEYRHPEFSREKLMAWLMSKLLSVHSHERVMDEHRWWIVSALEGRWELAKAGEEEIKKRETLARRTVEKHGLSGEQLLGRNRYSDEAGWREADAVAYMAARYLVETTDEGTLQELARATVTKQFLRQDIRAVLWHWMNPVRQAFAKITDVDLDRFGEDLKKYILEHGDPPELEKEEEE